MGSKFYCSYVTNVDSSDGRTEVYTKSNVCFSKTKQNAFDCLKTMMFKHLKETVESYVLGMSDDCANEKSLLYLSNCLKDVADIEDYLLNFEIPKKNNVIDHEQYAKNITKVLMENYIKRYDYIVDLSANPEYESNIFHFVIEEVELGQEFKLDFS